MSDSRDKTASPLDFLSAGWQKTGLLPNAGPLAKVHVLDNEIEAQVLHDVLNSADIPHSVESYRDFALDGIFQTTRGWGGIVVRAEDAERAIALIRRALADILQPATTDD